MQKILYLVGIFVILITSALPVTAQSNILEWVETLGRGTIYQASLSADGEKIVVTGNRGIWVYDDQFNDLAHINTGTVWQMAWSSDDVYLAALSDDSRLTVWHMSDYQQVSEVIFSDENRVISSLEAMTWKPDSHVLTLAYRDEIIFWDADNQTTQDTLSAPTENYKTDIAWSPDGNRLAVGTLSEVALWDMRAPNSSIQVSFVENEREKVRPVHLDWSPDGLQIAVVENWSIGYSSSSQNNTLSILDATTGDITRVIQAGFAADVDWSPDGTMIATATSEFGNRVHTPIKVWDSNTGKLMAQLVQHAREAHTIQWHPDGQRLLSAAYDNTARLWDVQLSLPINQSRNSLALRGHMNRVNVIAWSPDSNYLTTGTEDGGIRVWDVASGQMLETNYQADLFGVQALDYSPDGRYLAAGGGENLVRIWGLTDDARFSRVSYEHGRSSIPGEGNPIGITAIKWSPDSHALASAGYDALIKLWQEKGDGDAETLRQGGWYILSLHWFADSTRLLTGGRGSEAWDTVSGEQLPMQCDGLDELAFEFSPNEQYLSLGDDVNGGYYLCDIRTGEKIHRSYRVLDWNPIHPVAVGLSSSASEIVLFDPLDTEETVLATIPVEAPVRAARWSPDGHYLAIGLDDGTVQVWRLN